MQTRTRIVLLMHPKEHRHQKCTTGRLTCLNLANSEIIPGVRFDDNVRFRALADDPDNLSFLLYGRICAWTTAAPTCRARPSCS
jgi:DTW domain-containing protein YfiP